MKTKKAVKSAKPKKAVTYKVGDVLLVKTAPESVSQLKGKEVTVGAVTKLDLVLNGAGTLVVSFHMIKRGVFEFQKKRQPKAA